MFAALANFIHTFACLVVHCMMNTYILIDYLCYHSNTSGVTLVSLNFNVLDSLNTKLDRVSCHGNQAVKSVSVCACALCVHVCVCVEFVVL